MPEMHAKLSPSASERWINCPLSVSLCSNAPDETSQYAEEGTEAHKLYQYKVEHHLGNDIEDPRSSFKYLNEEMEEYSDDYAAFISEIIEKLKRDGFKPHVFTEIRLDMSRYAPECFGTSDCLIVYDHGLHVIDYKHGKGVEVMPRIIPR